MHSDWLRKRGGLIGASRTGFFFLDVASGKTTPISDPEADLPDNRFNDGKVDRITRMPVQHVTSLTFGGPDLDTLYITSGALRLSDAEQINQPTAGHLFALDPRVQGIAEPRFAG